MKLARLIGWLTGHRCQHLSVTVQRTGLSNLHLHLRMVRYSYRWWIVYNKVPLSFCDLRGLATVSFGFDMHACAEAVHSTRTISCICCRMCRVILFFFNSFVVVGFLLSSPTHGLPWTFILFWINVGAVPETREPTNVERFFGNRVLAIVYLKKNQVLVIQSAHIAGQCF
jgi:hypothetical protein